MRSVRPSNAMHLTMMIAKPLIFLLRIRSHYQHLQLSSVLRVGPKVPGTSSVSFTNGILEIAQPDAVIISVCSVQITATGAAAHSFQGIDSICAHAPSPTALGNTRTVSFTDFPNNS